MKCFVTSIGETTTEICVEQLIKYGFDVILLDEPEYWVDKYKRFLRLAEECGDKKVLRMDADFIPGPEIRKIFDPAYNDDLMTQFAHWDIYMNKLKMGQPVMYDRDIYKYIDIRKLDPLRPETSVSHIQAVHDRFGTIWDAVVGIHGLGQRGMDIARHMVNRKTRGHYEECDFKLVEKINALLK